MHLNLSDPGVLLNNGISYVDGMWFQKNYNVKVYYDLDSYLSEANRVRSVLNYSNLNELAANKAVLTPSEYYRVKSTLQRIDQFPNRFAREGQQYSENAGIMAMSHHSRKNAFCMCSFGFKRCGLWRLCPCCCHMKRMEILRKFLSVFYQGSWFFSTLSWKRSLLIESPAMENLGLYWGACDFAIRHLIDDGLISGAFVFEALSIGSYMPVLRALPHNHLIMFADTITDDTMETFKKLVRSYKGQKWNSKKKQWEELAEPEDIMVEPTTLTYRIDAQNDFANILNYMVVPMDFASKYKEAFSKAWGSNRKDIAFVNQNVLDLIDLCEFMSANRDGHYYRGTLHHSSGDFHGIKKSMRKTAKHKCEVRELLNECSRENLIAFPFTEKTPIEKEMIQECPSIAPACPEDASKQTDTGRSPSA